MTDSDPRVEPTTHWTVGEKYGFGTVCDHESTDPSRVWYTLTEGAVTEVRFPRIDVMNVRTVDFLVTDGDGYAARTFRERRDREPVVERTTEATSDEALLFRQTARPTDDRDWELTVDHVAHPDEDALVLDVDFEGEGYDCYVVVDPALSCHADHDVARATDDGLLARHEPPTAESAFVSDDGDGVNVGLDIAREGPAMNAEADVETTVLERSTAEDGRQYSLVAHHDEGEPERVFRDEDDHPIDVGLGVASADGFDWTTVDHREGSVETALLTAGDASQRRERAAGNVVMAGRLSGGDATVALGFAEDSDDEAALATAQRALETPVEDVRAAYADSWRSYLDGVAVPDSVADDDDLLAQYRTAVMVMKAADSKRYPGAGIASPSVPWGDAVEANEPADYGYNYVWGRDLYHTFTGFEAVGDVESAIDATEYIYARQQREDGFLPQNTFLDGRTRWGGEQLDEIAVPQVMAQQLHERHGYGFEEADYDYEHVRRSSAYIVANGPDSQQERWEEEAGYSPSTTAAQIAGLVCAADLAQAAGERADAIAYLGVADHWADRLEDWHASETGTDRHEHTPYYVRVTDEGNPDDGELRTHANGGGTLDERDIIDGGFLELVRLGIRPADDETVRNTVAEYDDDIMVETPHGPAWYRYTGDGYGEKSFRAGAPWQPDMTGTGRLWAFLSGERGEYELHLDDPTFEPTALLETMAGFGNDGRMLPEQVWDHDEGNAFDWAFGEGTSSATPLSWTNAQFVRLAWSIDAGEPVETPAVVADRYLDGGRPAGPALDVTVERTEAGVTITGETDGEEVVVTTESETAHTEGGDIDLTVDAPAGGRVTVVAATGDLPDVATTTRQQSV